MPFMQRLQSAMILKTSLHHQFETNILEHPEKRIYKAIEQNNTIRIQEKIFDGYDVDLVSSHHIPAIIYATIHNKVECINTLLENGANINIKEEKNGRTALHFAINLCLYELIHLLLKFGANPEQRDKNGLSSLDYAHNYNDDKSIALLNKTTPLELTCKNVFECIDSGKILELPRIMNSKNDLFSINAIGQSYLFIALQSKNLKLINYLKNKGLNIDAKDSKGNTPLLFAILNLAPLHVIKYLCTHSASIEIKNIYAESPLLSAMKLGLEDVTTYLIDFGANINITENVNTSLTLCHYAIHTFTDKIKHFREIQTKLIAKGATVDIYLNKLKWTPLMQCVTQKEINIIKDHFEVLIQLGANVNKQDLNGRTALMLAASAGNGYYLNRLLENYADLDLVDDFGWNALTFGVFYSQIEIVKELIDAGSDINNITNAGQSVLQIAIQKENQELISLLKENGALSDIN